MKTMTQFFVFMVIVYLRRLSAFNWDCVCCLLCVSLCMCMCVRVYCMCERERYIAKELVCPSCRKDLDNCVAALLK